MNVRAAASRGYSTSALQILAVKTVSVQWPFLVPCREMGIGLRVGVKDSKWSKGQFNYTVGDCLLALGEKRREVFMATPTSFDCSPLSRYINFNARGAGSLKTNRTGELNKNLY